MALVTGEAPSSPPGRKVVVVREGPSKKRPIIIDAVFGVVGVVLLVASVMLVNILPEEDVVNPQYRVRFTGYPSEATAFPTQYAYLLEGETTTFSFDVPHANLYQLSMNVIVIDDHPATYADLFTFLITAPNGTEYVYNGGDSGRVSTKDTAVNDANSGVTFYVSETGTTPMNQNIGGLPREYFFTTTPNATLEEVERALSAIHDVPATVGTWKVTVTLVDAGDCPDANPTAGTGMRGMECRLQNPNDPVPEGGQEVDPSRPEIDPGNRIGINFGYMYYLFDVEAP